MEHVFKLGYTTRGKTTAYHPQTNGLTERLSKTITDVQHKTWNEILPYITFAYNTATQETTRFTPFYLVYGREVQTMLEAMQLKNALSKSCVHCITDAVNNQAERLLSAGYPHHVLVLVAGPS